MNNKSKYKVDWITKDSLPFYIGIENLEVV